MTVQGSEIRIRGQVQGVGFRPCVWLVARDMALCGEVLNDADGVLIRLATTAPDAFVSRLRAMAPPLARIDAVECAPYRFPAPPHDFRIAASGPAGANTRVTPDAATCPACLTEIRDPAERRHGYAFANCTHCGPRFSILRGLPYDRAQTSMAAFPMCDACRAEYDTPADRRFHAQPIACARCGPHLWLEQAGAELAGDPIATAAQMLRNGAIIAIKGLGGFHIACDARNPAALHRLRTAKHRPAKPFALMGTLPLIAQHCSISAAAQQRLTDPAAPVVLLAWAGGTLPDAVAPGMATLGWMLPYTPLHHLLLDAFNAPLVMTSGNISGQPQLIDDAVARVEYNTYTDAILTHDRRIERRLDDSVERADPPMVLRRARGRVPATIPLPDGFDDAPQVLAFGGQIKGAICLVKSGQALLSQHLGDLDDALTFDEYNRAIADYTALFDHAPALLACDMHPGYRATQAAETMAENTGLPLVQTQHHHAHLAACLGENNWPLDGGPVAGIVLDGTGFGADNTIWGGELLLGDYRAMTRAAHLRPAPLPGGDGAARQPWRNALARLDQAGLAETADALFPDAPRALLRQAIAAEVNAPLSSSAGRLFDAMAAILGLCPDHQTYEGEAAMRLEALAGRAQKSAPLSTPPGGATIDTAPTIRSAIRALDQGSTPAAIAKGFHDWLARSFADRARALVDSGAARAVALSGGCLQNAQLHRALLRELDGLSVLTHATTPAGDGGLALGQALVAIARQR